MNNVIAKTALKTVLILLTALLVAFSIAALGFPQHMATACENVGAYSLATGFSALRYTYTKDIGDLARCVEDSILAEDNSDIVSFCDKLLSGDKSEFEEYAKTRTEGVWAEYDYRQYILGAFASARYETGEKDGAIDAVRYAVSTVTGFPVPNAAGDLAATLSQTDDSQTKAKLYDLLIDELAITPEAGQEDYFTAVLRALSN